MSNLNWQSNSSIWYSDAEAAPYRILIVDDDANLARLLRAILRTAGFEVVVTNDADEAIDVAKIQAVHVIILDLMMPKVDGRTLYREMRLRGITTPVLIASAYGARAAQMELGAEASIEKPFDPDRLIQAVTELLPVERSQRF